MFLLALDLIGRRQVGERMGPQVEGEEMAGGILGAIVRRGRVMRGGGVKVTVARMDLEALQLRHATPEIPTQFRQAAGQAVGTLGDQSQAAGTFEGLKEMARRRSLQTGRRQVLEKTPAGAPGQRPPPSAK